MFLKTVKPLFSDKICHKEIVNLTENGKVLTQDMEIAKAFNSYFKSIVQTLCNQVEETSTESDIVCFLDPVSKAINKYGFFFYFFH